jgi:hypothetical protein
MVADKWNDLRAKLTAAVNTSGTVYEKIKRVIGILVMVLYRLRKIFLAIPVVYYALKLARYNMEHLPEQVGINLQADGFFADTISREMAVMGPLVLTGGCLVLMLFSRKALPSWAICVFTLVLPILLLVSNIYPA